MKHIHMAALVIALPVLAQANTITVQMNGAQNPSAMKNLVGHLLGTPGVTAVRSDVSGRCGDAYHHRRYRRIAISARW